MFKHCFTSRKDLELRKCRALIDTLDKQISSLKKELLVKNKVALEEYDLYNEYETEMCPVCLSHIYKNNYVRKTHCCKKYIHSHCCASLIKCGYMDCILCNNNEPYSPQ